MKALILSIVLLAPSCAAPDPADRRASVVVGIPFASQAAYGLALGSHHWGVWGDWGGFGDLRVLTTDRRPERDQRRGTRVGQARSGVALNIGATYRLPGTGVGFHLGAGPSLVRYWDEYDGNGERWRVEQRRRRRPNITGGLTLGIDDALGWQFSYDTHLRAVSVAVGFSF